MVVVSDMVRHRGGSSQQPERRPPPTASERKRRQDGAEPSRRGRRRDRLDVPPPPPEVDDIGRDVERDAQFPAYELAGPSGHAHEEVGAQHEEDVEPQEPAAAPRATFPFPGGPVDGSVLPTYGSHILTEFYAGRVSYCYIIACCQFCFLFC